MARPRVLVTGAAGFIGRASLEPLRAAGYEVCAVLSPRPDALDRAGAVLPEIEVRHADLTDPLAVDALLDAAKPTHLLHFAWVATPGLYWQSEENYRWLSASRHLLAAFGRHGGVRAVMAGSCAEYDWSRVEVCHERSSPLADAAGTVTPYAACKIAMQRSLEEYGRSHGISTAWGRIFFQYGPGEHRDRLIASVIVNLLAGREARCTHGRQIRSFLHVEDVGAAFAALLASAVQGPVNVGSGDRIAIAELLERLAREIGRPDLLKLGARAAPPGEPAVLVPDIGRLREEVRWNPRWRLDEGLKDTVRWWRARLV
ncbi:MAG: NAD(P)-dependent oxidoreductase [Steroidobacteraceae bacterium]|jgi:nucleoside-diphosphate-sugar epimerase